MPAGQRGGQLRPGPDPDSGAADQGERHVRAQTGGERVQLGLVQPQPPQRVAGEQGRRRVRAPTGHAAGDGDLLAQTQVHVGGDACRLGQGARGADREVAPVGGQAPCALALDRDRDPAGRRLGGHLVEQADRLEDGDQVVVAVGPHRTHRQLQVHLRRDADGDRSGGGGTVVRRACHGDNLGAARPRAPRSRSGRSPRRRAAPRAAAGRPRPRRSTSSAATAPPAQRARAARNVLRRWANAASTTANTAARRRSRPAARRGSARPARSRRSAPARTPCGRPTRPCGRRRTRRLDRRDAVRARPRRGGEPLGHLGLHHHQHPAHRGQHVQQVQQHRHRDVVRQVRHQCGRWCTGPGHHVEPAARAAHPRRPP